MRVESTPSPIVMFHVRRRTDGEIYHVLRSDGYGGGAGEDLPGRIGEIVAAECNTRYTTFLASGGVLIDGKLVKGEYTAVFVIAFTTEEDVRRAVDVVCEELGLKAVLLERQHAKEELILK